MVGRYLTVECSGFAPDGTPLRLQARGWQARILQHEVRAAHASHAIPTNLLSFSVRDGWQACGVCLLCLLQASLCTARMTSLVGSTRLACARSAAWAVRLSRLRLHILPGAFGPGVLAESIQPLVEADSSLLHCGTPGCPNFRAHVTGNPA